MAKKVDTEKTERKIKEALEILEALGFPRQQQNERSALTLLALLDLKPEDAWETATAPLMGITPMMEFFAHHCGKRYAPNTRETVRRQTVHQFVQAGLIVPNPDKPSRPTNSPKAVYQIEPSALKLLRLFGKSQAGTGSCASICVRGRDLKEALCTRARYTSASYEAGEWPRDQAFSRWSECIGKEDHR